MAGKTCGYDPYENVVKVMEKAMDIGHIMKILMEESTLMMKHRNALRNSEKNRKILTRILTAMRKLRKILNHLKI